MKKTKLTMLTVLPFLLLTGCNNSNSKTNASSNEAPSSVKEPEKVGDIVSINDDEAVITEDFEITTDLAESFEIHTAAQKEYLSYEGDYATIDPSLYPDGSKSISDSLPVKLEWNHEVPADKELKNYSVYFGQYDDLSDGYEVKGTKETSIDVYNSFLGTNYFRIVARYTDDTIDCTAIDSYEVDGTAPRNLMVGTMTNCRDMGGRETEFGGKVKQGLVYRTSGNKYDYSTQIDEVGKEVMLNQLKVKTEINVNDSNSYDVGLPGVNKIDCLMNYGGSASHHFSRNTESVKNFFEAVADENNYPVFFHCRIGTDRTGLCANLLAGLLGVPLNMIYQDYLFSNFGKIGEKRYIGSRAGQDNIENYMNEILAMPGEKFANKVYNMLLAIGLSSETLDKVISNLTDGDLPDNNNGQVVATADKFDVTGATVTEDTSVNNHPDHYVVLNSLAVSASYTFEMADAAEVTVVAYLGNTEHSTSKKIADAITCDIDGDEVEIEPTMTYADACMGNVSNRMNYYPVILGTLDLDAGEHTVKITGTTNTMNLGTLCVYPL